MFCGGEQIPADVDGAEQKYRTFSRCLCQVSGRALGKRKFFGKNIGYT